MFKQSLESLTIYNKIKKICIGYLPNCFEKQRHYQQDKMILYLHHFLFLKFISGHTWLYLELTSLKDYFQRGNKWMEYKESNWLVSQVQREEPNLLAMLSLAPLSIFFFFKAVSKTQHDDKNQILQSLLKKVPITSLDLKIQQHHNTDRYTQV